MSGKQKSTRFRSYNIEARIWASTKIEYSVSVLYKLSIDISFIEKQTDIRGEDRLYLTLSFE